MDEGDQLLRRCQAGDASALSDLVRLYQAPIFRLAYQVLRDAALAEEATADALAKVWAKCRQWRGDSRAGAWIYRLAVRTILDCRRSRRRWLQLWSSAEPAEVLDPKLGPVEEVSRKEQRQEMSRRLAEALGHLSETDRALVHLYYFEQRSLGEIESILSVARDALKMRLARARQRLLTLLEGCDELL